MRECRLTITYLKQRSALSGPGPFQLLCNRDIEKHHHTCVSHDLAIVLRQNRTASRGNDYLLLSGEICQHGRFASTEARLAFDIKNPGDIGTGPRLDFRVGIDKAIAQQL